MTDSGNHHLRPHDNPLNYGEVLVELKQRVHRSRYRAQRVVNSELIRLYWQVGKVLVVETAKQGWGSKVLERLSLDLKAEFPGITGFSVTNLKYMRSFAEAWPDESTIGPQSVDQLPWGHVRVLVSSFDDAGLRDWYAGCAVAHGWSRNTLEHQIRTRAHERFGTAPTNFDRVLDSTDSDLAKQLTRDPYVFDFLTVDSDANEREIEQAMVERITRTLGEFGTGFAFVGRQVHVSVAGDDFYIDMLFFHVDQLRYVVVELKVGKFKPEYSGQLGFYVSLVDDVFRRPQHGSTVGLILCSDKNDQVVRYALGGSTQPVAVASYDLLPPADKAALPSEEMLGRAFRNGPAGGAHA